MILNRNFTHTQQAPSKLEMAGSSIHGWFPHLRTYDSWNQQNHLADTCLYKSWKVALTCWTSCWTSWQCVTFGTWRCICNMRSTINYVKFQSNMSLPLPSGKSDGAESVAVWPKKDKDKLKKTIISVTSHFGKQASTLLEAFTIRTGALQFFSNKNACQNPSDNAFNACNVLNTILRSKMLWICSTPLQTWL